MDCLSDLSVANADSIQSVNPTNVLIVGSLSGITITPSQTSQLKTFVSLGGQILMLHPGNSLAALFPDRVKAYKAKDGEIVTMHASESPVFSGIEPLDIAWFDRGGRRLPIACTGIYQIVSSRKDIWSLADQCDVHGYLTNTSQIQKYEGTPLVELRVGKGRLIASEINFESATNDPISKRLLSNTLRYLAANPP